MGEMIQKFKYDALKEAHDELKEKYVALKDKYEGLVFDFQELKAKHQSAGESIEHVRNDCRKLRDENDVLKRRLYYALDGGTVSKTPSVVINTKSINIAFDNHTNNFKEDDTND